MYPNPRLLSGPPRDQVSHRTAEGIQLHNEPNLKPQSPGAPPEPDVEHEPRDRTPNRNPFGISARNPNPDPPPLAGRGPRPNPNPKPNHVGTTRAT